MQQDCNQVEPAHDGGGTGGPSPSRPAPVPHVLKWLAAALCVPAVEVLITVAVSFGISTLLMAWQPQLIEGGSEGLSDFVYSNILAINVVIQLAWLAVMLPWWRRVHACSIVGARRDRARMPGALAGRRIVLLAGMGVAIQFLMSGLLNLVLPLFPAVQSEYQELSAEMGLGDFSFIVLLTTVFLAPLVEELMMRGLVFEFALRAFSFDFDAWRRRAFPARGDGRALAAPPTGKAAFWLANGVQALCFAVNHGNITQGCYAFAIGLILGWVVWQTGRLADSIVLHFCVNAGSYLTVLIPGDVRVAGLVAITAVSLVVLVALARSFQRATRSKA